jgi:peptidoglycan/LPS O-acetylase OafA/YrhL
VESKGAIAISAKRLVSVYSIFVGLFMIGFWLMLLLTDQVPSDQKPFAISFHLAGEFLTAVLLAVSGVGIWLKKSWSKSFSFLALGLLLYTVVVSPGYYAQLGEMPMVAIFMILTVLTLVSIVIQFKSEKAES